MSDPFGPPSVCCDVSFALSVDNTSGADEMLTFSFPTLLHERLLHQADQPRKRG